MRALNFYLHNGKEHQLSDQFLRLFQQQSDYQLLFCLITLELYKAFVYYIYHTRSFVVTEYENILRLGFLGVKY